MTQQPAHGRRWQWPAGILNRILLLSMLVAFLLRVEGLAAYLFGGRQLNLPQPWWRDVAAGAISLALVLALALVRIFRERFPLLLAAQALWGLTSLLQSTALWLPAAWLVYAAVAVSVLSCASAVVGIVSLTRGERWDEFVLAVPLALLAALMRRDLGAAWPLDSPPRAGQDASS